MIEELKLVLDSIGDLTGVALWVVGFFIVFKLVVYLSTTGAVVYLVKLAIMKGSEVIKKERVYKFKSHPIDEETVDSIDELLHQIKRSGFNYIHNTDVQRVILLIRKDRDAKNANNKTN